MGLLHPTEVALQHRASVERIDHQSGFALGVVEEHAPSSGRARDAYRFEAGRRARQTFELADAKGFFQSLVGVDQTITIVAVPIFALHVSVLARSLFQNLHHLLVRQVRVSLQPQRDRAGHEGSRLRSAFHQTVPRFVSPSAHRSRQEQVFIAGIEALGQFVLRTVDERTGSQHGGFEIVLVEERAVGRETGDVAHFLLADLFALVVGVRGIGTYGDGAGNGGRTFAHDVLIIGLERCRLVVFHGALRNAGRKTVAVHPHVEVFGLFVIGFRRDLEADFHIDVVGRTVFFAFLTGEHGIFPSRAEVQEIAVQFAVVVGVDHAEFATLVDHFFPIFGRLREHFAARIEEGRDFEVGCAVGRAAPDVYVGVELIFRLAVDHTLEIDIDQQVFGFAGRKGGLRMDVQVTFVADGRRDESAAAVQEFVDALVIVRRAVVRARLTAETHVDHPRLFGLLGIFLHEFHILHDFRVVKRGGNHDDVGFGRHPF